MSSSQLTFTPSCFRGVDWNHQPADLWFRQQKWRLNQEKFGFIVDTQIHIYSWEYGFIVEKYGFIVDFWLILPSGKHTKSMDDLWFCPQNTDFSHQIMAMMTFGTDDQPWMNLEVASYNPLATEIVGLPIKNCDFSIVMWRFFPEGNMILQAPIMRVEYKNGENQYSLLARWGSLNFILAVFLCCPPSPHEIL